MFTRKTVDNNNGGMEMSMFEQTDEKAAIQLESNPGWFKWAGRHPGLVALGALVVAVVALNKSLKIREIEPDTGDEEVPLFI